MELSPTTSSFIICLVILSSSTQIWGHPGVLEDDSNNEINYKTTYEGYKVIRTEAIQRIEVADALMVFDGLYGVHFWTFPKVNQTTDIMTSADAYENVKAILDEMDISHKIIIQDVMELMKNENPEVPQQHHEHHLRQAQHRMNWDNYHRYDVIKDFCRAMANSRSSLVSSEVIGKSTEGRDIIMVKISKSSENKQQKPAIFIDGGMHAREWISPATTTYIMNKLISDNGNNQDLLDNFDWYFVPVINVDGYEYTHTRQRMWRKTRARTNSWLGCQGVDPNRNWDFHWAESGSSSNPCSDIYHGPKAFSEPETKAVADAILARKSDIVMYLTFHSYSQLWLVPYGYGNEKPSDYNELMELGRIGVKSLEDTFGTRYKIGTAPDLLYKAAGGSDDWAKGAAGIKYSYTLELRDTGDYGFILPANQIKPTGEETFNGVAAVARSIFKKLNKN